MINQNMYKLGASPSKIRELFEYSKKRKAEIGENNVFDYSLGNPSVEAPKIVGETLNTILATMPPAVLHAYTSSAGDLLVRQSIANYLNKKYQTSFNENLIYLTVGAAASLTISFHALLNPGDEVIVFAPYFPEYKVFIEGSQGKMVVIEPNYETFEPDLIKFQEAITEKTKIVLINYPNNPTGVVLSKETLKAFAQILKDKELEYQHPIYLVSDEPYRELIYDNEEIPFVSNYYDNTLICYSFSKSLSLPGERIGYIVVSDNCLEADQVFSSINGAGRSLGFVCAPALFQYMLPACLGYTSDLNIYKQNRDELYSALTSYGYEVVKPGGAFYLFVKALEEDANVFVEKAKKYELILVPSDSFGVKGYVRVAYCVSREQVKNSLPAFKKLIDDYCEE